MRALVCDRYGPPEVVQLVEVPEPVPGPREVVVQLQATTVNSGDARLRAARFPDGMALLARLGFGWSRPRQRVLGVDVAGTVMATGAEVTGFAVGDRVLGMTGMKMGAHAEQCTLSTDHCLVPLPADVSFEEAVTLPFGGNTALSYLEDRIGLRSGERLLVIGASGAVGAACVQIGRLLGAKVTGVCSGANAALVSRLGAEQVIDYTAEDVFGTDARWDVVIDTIGEAPVSAVCRLATPSGRVGLVASGLPQMLAGLWISLTSRKRVVFGPADEKSAHLARLVGWLAAGEYVPVIDARLPLERGVEAHARVDSGHKKGSLVLTFPQP